MMPLIYDIWLSIGNGVPYDAYYTMLKDPKYVPLYGFFMLPLTRSNYNTLYSLAVVAAVNHYTLTIRIVLDIVYTEYPKISYMRVTW